MKASYKDEYRSKAGKAFVGCILVTALVTSMFFMGVVPGVNMAALSLTTQIIAGSLISLCTFAPLIFASISILGKEHQRQVTIENREIKLKKARLENKLLTIRKLRDEVNKEEMRVEAHFKKLEKEDKVNSQIDKKSNKTGSKNTIADDEGLEQDQSQPGPVIISGNRAPNTKKNKEDKIKDTHKTSKKLSTKKASN